MTGRSVSVSEALQALWPVLTTLGGGYVGLLVYIRKLMEERIRDKDVQIQQLREERDDFKRLAMRGIATTERAVDVLPAIVSSPHV